MKAKKLYAWVTAIMYDGYVYYSDKEDKHPSMNVLWSLKRCPALDVIAYDQDQEAFTQYSSIKGSRVL